LRREDVQYTEFVPVVMRSLLEYVRHRGLSLNFMRAIVLGSDRWYLREHSRLKGMAGPETMVLHTFGQTETSIDATYFTGTQVEVPEHGLTPIGVPFPGVRIHIVDEQLRPVPVGEIGEMLIGGVGVV